MSQSAYIASVHEDLSRLAQEKPVSSCLQWLREPAPEGMCAEPGGREEGVANHPPWQKGRLPCTSCLYLYLGFPLILRVASSSSHECKYASSKEN